MLNKRSLTALAAAATVMTGLAATPAEARYRYDNGGYSGYDNGGYYGNNYRRCSSGTTGTIVGGVVGVLAGREVAKRGDRTVGAIIGGAAGALAGRALDKASSRCRR